MFSYFFFPIRVLEILVSGLEVFHHCLSSIELWKLNVFVKAPSLQFRTFYSKFATFTVFEKKSGFPKKATFCPEKRNFHMYLRNITISIGFYGKFTLICRSKFLNSESSGHSDVFIWKENKKRSLCLDDFPSII